MPATRRPDHDPTDPSERLTVRAVEAARLLGVSTTQITRWTRDGTLPCKRVGAVVLIRREDLIAFVEPDRPRKER